MTTKNIEQRAWSGLAIDALIDRELRLNPELRDGTAVRVDIRDAHAAGENVAGLIEYVIDDAGRRYRACASPTDLVTFSDGSTSFLFDIAHSRTVLAWGISRATAARSRDTAYHAGYPRAGDDLDKGHAWAHAQGGREGGPNYFRQARRLNQARSHNGRLWRAIEQHLASNPRLTAFVQLVYAEGDLSDCPAEVEYGLFLAGGTFRAVIFPNR